MNNDQKIGRDPGDAGDMWSINAEESLQAVLESPGCPPLLRQTLSGALTWQNRNRRMVRRAVASPRVAPQWSAALLALGATVTLEGSAGSSEVAVETLLAQRPKGEITALHVRMGGVRWGEAHVGRTPADEPIVAAVAGVEISEQDGVIGEARVALTGVGPVRLAKAPTQLIGTPVDDRAELFARIGAVAQAMEQEVTPEGDYLGSEEYRRAMAGVLTRRALEQCLAMQSAHQTRTVAGGGR